MCWPTLVIAKQSSDGFIETKNKIKKYSNKETIFKVIGGNKYKFFVCATIELGIQMLLVFMQHVKMVKANR